MCQDCVLLGPCFAVLMRTRCDSLTVDITASCAWPGWGPYVNRRTVGAHVLQVLTVPPRVIAHFYLLTVVAILALSASALLTRLILRSATGSGMLDVPNPRSSHVAPTPRGGGAAIALATTMGLLVLALRGPVRWDLLSAVVGGGLACAFVGLADDRRPLPASIRLIVHFASALWGLVWLGGLPTIQVGTHMLSFGWAGYILGALGIVWAVNLFNFMDGIDGIAASEAIFITSCGALLAGTASAGAAALVLGAACLGFLRWNWPAARIFMGDVGSGYLGYVLAVLALAASRDNSAAIWVWLILGGAFFVDATVTLLRRLHRGERVYQAHRTHAYQWLARRWGHRPVTLAVCLLNVVWLLPCAAFASARPALAAVTTVVAFAPLVGLAIAAGSGCGEASEHA